MATQQSTRIWENDSAAPAPNRTSQPQAATLPSIATLTNELPPGANGQPSPIYSTNRSSDQWATPPQSTRKLHRLQLSCPLKPPISACTTLSSPRIRLTRNNYCEVTADALYQDPRRTHLDPMAITTIHR